MPPSKRTGDKAILAALGANLKQARLARGLTQEKLAEHMDVEARTIQMFEAGDRNISVPKLVRLQAILSCSWERLLPGGK